MDDALELDRRVPARPAAARVVGALRERVAPVPHAVLALILTLAAFLDFWRLSQNGWANTYYAAAVRSMAHSWHAFFFAAFDPGGLVSVDKPPLSLWVEALSARIFGFSSFSILLPEALAGVVAVWLLYLLVARIWGRAAGLVAALALATTPVSVVTNRDNNPDAFLALLLVATAYCAVRATQARRLRWLVGAAACAGLAFNAKTLVALVVVPGAALAYLLFAGSRWRTRLWHLLAAGAVLGAVSFAWLVTVDLIPKDSRPYVSGTSDDSELTLALDYNGFGRVDGQRLGGGPGGFRGGGPGAGFRESAGGPGGPGGVNTFSSGTPGTLRLINDALGDQAGWLLPLALVGGLSALLAAALARRRVELGGLAMLGGWFVAAGGVFSYSSGIIHTYYLSSLAPATAGLVGAGTVALWRDARRGGLRLVLPLAAVALTAWLEVSILRRSGYLPWIQDLAIAAAAAAGVLLVAAALPGRVRVPRRAWAPAAALGAAVLGFSVAPAAWAETALEAPINGTLPGAGPNFVGSGGFGGGGRTFGGGPSGPGPNLPGLGRPQRGGGFAFGGPGPGGGGDIGPALAYAKAHGGTSAMTLLVQGVQEASASIIAGEHVSAMSGFSGGILLTPKRLARLVARGSARYVLVGGGGFGRIGGFGQGGPAGGETLSKIQSACREVPTTAWHGSGGTLYDCAGRAAALAS